jgi:hypothetical protein
MARDYHIRPDGNGFQVRTSFSDGRVRITGRFLSKSHAQLWIDDQVELAGRLKRDAAVDREKT